MFCTYWTPLKVPCKSSRWRRQLCSIVFSTNFWLTMLIPSVTDWNYKAAYIRICLVRWSFPKHRPTISMKPHVLLLVTLHLVTVCYPFLYAPPKKESVPTEVEIVSARCRRCQYPDAHPTEAQCHSGRPLLHVRYKVSQGRVITHSCKFSYHDIAPLLPP